MRYKLDWDQPLSVPEAGLELVLPGQTVETALEINHPGFKLIPEKKTEAASEKKATAAEAKQG